MKSKLAMLTGISVAVAGAQAQADSNQSSGTNATSSTSPPVNAAETGGLEDIMVTAQRRSENLQDVPVSVTAFTAATLERLAIKDFTDIARVTPGVTLQSQNGFLSTNIRGVGGNVGGPGIELQTAVYVDDVYYSFAQPQLLELSSISQIAVLKGPQGTLFGRNATAGVLQITSLDPPKTPTMHTRISYENYERVQASTYPV